MVSIVAILVWRTPIYIVLPVFMVFALWDGMFLSAALTKVPQGAWVTLMIAGILTAIFVLWRYGKEEQWKSEKKDNTPLSRVLHLNSIENGTQLELNPTLGGGPILSTSGLGIFFDKTGSQAIAPHILIQFLEKFRTVPQFMVLFHMRPLQMATVAPEDRYSVSRCFASQSGGKEKVPIPNCFRLVLRYGYTDEVITPDLCKLVANAVRAYLTVESNEEGEDVRASLDALDRAYHNQCVYIVGNDQLRIKQGTNFIRWGVLTAFIWMRGITSRKIQRLNVQVDRLVEVGFVRNI